VINKQNAATETTADYAELVTLVAGVADTPELLVAEHIPDPTGHCRGCYSTTLAAPMWPCILAMLGRHVLLRTGHRVVRQCAHAVPGGAGKQPADPARQGLSPASERR
jgi:hypothetical protein